MSADNPQRGTLSPTQQAVYERLRLLNDQLEIFHAVRRIVTEPTALSAYPAATVRQIQDLYREFDRKHPSTPAPKGADQ